MIRRQPAGTQRATSNCEATLFLTLNFLLVGTATPGAKTLVNLGKDGLALRGYDPVAFFTEGGPALSDAKFQSRYCSAAYQFVSEENKKAFDQAPRWPEAIWPPSQLMLSEW